MTPRGAASRPAPSSGGNTRTSNASNKGGRPKADVKRMAEKLNAAIDRAMLDATIRPTKAAICSSAEVPERTVDAKKGHPLILEVLTRLRDLKDGRKSVAEAVAGVLAPRRARAAGTRADQDPSVEDVDPRDPAVRAAALDDVQVATQFARASRRAAEACMRFAGKHRRAGHVSDLPVAVRNLEITLRELSAARDSLLLLATEWVRRNEEELRGPMPSRPELPL